MSALNVANRTLAIMDNLRFLRHLNNECVDLIAIDPPSPPTKPLPAVPARPSATPNMPRNWRWRNPTAPGTTKAAAKPASATSGTGMPIPTRIGKWPLRTTTRHPRRHRSR